jgi:hypothetical protein
MNTINETNLKKAGTYIKNIAIVLILNFVASLTIIWYFLSTISFKYNIQSELINKIEFSGFLLAFINLLSFLYILWYLLNAGNCLINSIDVEVYNSKTK